MENIKMGSLTLSIEKIKGKTILDWIGESNEKKPSEELIPFFNEFIENQNNDLIIKFDKLNYMNSSTIHPLILFIKDLNEKNIKIEICYNKNSKWQKEAFKAMENLTSILKNIKFIGI